MTDIQSAPDALHETASAEMPAEADALHPAEVAQDLQEQDLQEQDPHEQDPHEIDAPPIAPAFPALAVAPPAEPWRRRMFGALMYGKADRHAKARARIGLAIIAFLAIYGIIAGRLVLYAMTPDGRGTAPLSAVMRSRPRGPTSSTATARCWRPT